MADTILDRLFYTLGLKTAPLEEGARKAESVLKRLDNAFKGLAGLGIASVGIGLLGKKLFDTGAIFVNAAADMEKLMQSLEASTGSAAKAADEFAKLQEAAKLPGLGLREVTQAVVNLQAVDFAAEQAIETVTQFGNALALVGRGKNELDGVTLALTQMQAKGKVFAEEINQIAERVPQIRKVMLQAFGTANSEDLQKMGITARQFVEGVTTELAKLPRVIGGTANAFENFGDTVFQLQARLGRLVLPQVTGFLDALSGSFTGLTLALERPEERLRRVTTEIGKSTTAFTATNSQIRSLQSQYNQLTTQLGTVNAESDEARRLHDELNGVIGQLVELIPSLNAQWDKEKGSLRDLTAEIERNQAARQSLIRAQFVEGLKAFTVETQRQQTQLANLTQGMSAVHRLAIEVGEGFGFVTEAFDGQVLPMARIAGKTETFGKILADLGVNIEAIPLATRALTVAFENGATGTDALGQAENLLRGQIAQTNTAIQTQADIFRKFVSAQGQDAIDTFNQLSGAMNQIGESRGAGIAFDRDMRSLAASLNVNVDLLRQMVATAALLAKQPITPGGAERPAETKPPPDPKTLLARVRQEMERVQTELRTGGETNAAVIAQAQVSAIDKILAEHHIAGTDLIKTYTAVADMRLDLIDKIIDAEREGVEKVQKEEDKRLDAVSQSRESFIAAKKEEAAKAQEGISAQQAAERKAATDRANLGKGLRDELTQISREAEQATTADAVMGLQNRLKAFEGANALYIAGSQDLARRVSTLNEELIEARFAVTGEVVTRRLESFDHEALDTLQNTLAAEGAAKDEAVRLGEKAIGDLKRASSDAELERAQFQRQMGQITLEEYRDFLSKRLSALEVAGRTETGAYRRLALDIRQVNLQIEDDTKRLTERSRQHWLSMFDAITSVAQLFSEEIGSIFSEFSQLLGTMTDPNLTDEEKVARNLSQAAALQKANNERGKQIDALVAQNNSLRDALEMPQLSRSDIPGERAGWLDDWDKMEKFLTENNKKLEGNLEDRQKILQEKNQAIRSAAERLGQAFETGLREGFLNLDFGDISENLADALDKMIIETIIAANNPQIIKMMADFSALVIEAAKDGVIIAAEAMNINIEKEQILQRQRFVDKLTRQEFAALGIEPDTREQAPKDRQGGISVAIRNITQRQADEMSMILRGNNAFAQQTAQNTGKTAALLETFLPSIEDRLAMLDGGIGALREPKRLARGDGPREAQIQLTRRRRARGR